jgi:hypothetical protein
MNTITEIQCAVQALPESQFKAFSLWFEKYEEERWDRQIECDQKSGPLHDLMKNARLDFEAGKCTQL